MPRDTKIEGESSQIRAAATWLRDSVGSGTSTFADTIYAQRSRATSAWRSEAGGAFCSQLSTVGEAADATSQKAKSAATGLDALATALDRAKNDMERARSVARAGDLVVTGTVIEEPGEAPPDVAALPADATPAESAAYESGVQAIEEYEAKVNAWNEAVGIADGADAHWKAAIEELGSTWQTSASDLETPYGQLFAGGAEGDGSTGFGNAAQQLLGGEFFNLFGLHDGFPLIPLGLAAGKMTRMARGIPPIFQTGIVGKLLLSRLSGAAGVLGTSAAWLNSPAGRALTTRLGIVGGVIGTGKGIYDLYQQGNPVEAFKREGAGYVADVAQTAFTASTTAFLVAPNPVTGAIAIGSGITWAGAEIVDHWDDISDTASDVWNDSTDFVSDRADDVADAWDAGTDFVSDKVDDVKDTITSLGGLL
jgi:hypothetical protein